MVAPELCHPCSIISVLNLHADRQHAGHLCSIFTVLSASTNLSISYQHLFSFGHGILPIAGDLFPSDYNQSLFIALHGSWNRDQKIGYKVVKATVDANGTVTSYSTFAQGWLQNADGGDAASVWGEACAVAAGRSCRIMVKWHSACA